jgi:AcrR family transcriptional regulator
VQAKLSANKTAGEVSGGKVISLSPGRRERQRQKTLAKIIRSARTLFARKGFEATTTQEIAEKADIGTGTLFNYAHSKEDLLILVFREEMELVVTQAFATMPKKASLLDQLLHVFDSFVAYHKRDLEIAHAMIKQLSSMKNTETRSNITPFMRGLMRRIFGLIKEAQERGELRRDFQRAILAHNLFSIYYGLLQEWLGEYISYEQYAARIRPALELQICGLRTEVAVTIPRGRNRN